MHMERNLGISKKVQGSRFRGQLDRIKNKNL